MESLTDGHQAVQIHVKAKIWPAADTQNRWRVEAGTGSIRLSFPQTEGLYFDISTRWQLTFS